MQGISAWYHLLLDALKQKRDPDLTKNGTPDTVIDIGDKVKGVFQHKLRHWFGNDAMLYKCEVPLDEEGNIVWKKLDFDPDTVTAIWAKPSSGDVYVLGVDGHYGRDFVENFKSLGLIAEPGPKLFKRLKRAFGVLTIGSARSFDYRIISDPTKAPEKLTDGMAFANTGFLSVIVRKPVTQGDVFQYSMLVPEGLTKGTVVAMDWLATDVVIPGTHNVKTELRSMGKRLFAIEGTQEPKTARTDLQTITNCGVTDLFRDQFYAEMEHLSALAEDPDYAAERYWEEFESEDWFGKMWQRWLRQREHNPKAPRPNLDHKPRLTAAHEMGIDIRVSPTLRKDFIKWQCARTNIHKLQVPVENSCAGYIIPDLSQFDSATGEFRPNPATVIRCNQIAFPTGLGLEHGPVAVVRQPNGLGEALVTNNVAAHLPSQGVQISPLAADPELSSIYGLPSLGYSWLDLAGGADYDDRVIAFGGSDTVTTVWKRIQEIKRLDLPKSNMEDIIDAAVQTSEFPWTIGGQLNAAVTRQSMDLGAAVNFMMALTLVKDWEFYRYAAESSNAMELANAQEQYLEGEEIPVYPDCWMPEDRYTHDPFARLPIEAFDGEDSRFAYYEAESVTTPVGELMTETAEAMDEFLENVFEHRFVDQQALINTIEGFQVIRNCITRVGLPGTKVGLALWSVYLKLTGRDPQYKGEFQSLVDSYEIISISADIGIAEKQREFGVVVNQLFAGRDEATRLAATAQFALKLLAPVDKRWHGPEGAKRPIFNAYGHDSWLFTPCRNENYELVMRDSEHLEPGLMHYWLVILKRFCDLHQL